MCGSVGKTVQILNQYLGGCHNSSSIAGRYFKIIGSVGKTLQILNQYLGGCHNSSSIAGM